MRYTKSIVFKNENINQSKSRSRMHNSKSNLRIKRITSADDRDKDQTGMSDGKDRYAAKILS